MEGSRSQGLQVELARFDQPRWRPPPSAIVLMGSGCDDSSFEFDDADLLPRASLTEAPQADRSRLRP